jgi:hypothetical protein
MATEKRIETSFGTAELLADEGSYSAKIVLNSSTSGYHEISLKGGYQTPWESSVLNTVGLGELPRYFDITADATGRLYLLYEANVSGSTIPSNGSALVRPLSPAIFLTEIGWSGWISQEGVLIASDVSTSFDWPQYSKIDSSISTLSDGRLLVTWQDIEWHDPINNGDLIADQTVSILGRVIDTTGEDAWPGSSRRNFQIGQQTVSEQFIVGTYETNSIVTLTHEVAEVTDGSVNVRVSQDGTVPDPLNPGYLVIDSTETIAVSVDPETLAISTPTLFYLGSDSHDSWNWGNTWADSVLPTNDLFIGGPDNDLFNGFEGYDIAVYTGEFANYKIERSSFEAVIVEDTSGFDGIDTLMNVELLRFTDLDVVVSDVVTPRVEITFDYDRVVPYNFSPITAGSITVDVNFSEEVVGFDVDDIRIDNASLTDFRSIDGAHYTFNLVPVPAADTGFESLATNQVSVEIDPLGIADLTGNHLVGSGPAYVGFEPYTNPVVDSWDYLPDGSFNSLKVDIIVGDGELTSRTVYANESIYYPGLFERVLFNSALGLEVVSEDTQSPLLNGIYGGFYEGADDVNPAWGLGIGFNERIKLSTGTLTIREGSEVGPVVKEFVVEGSSLAEADGLSTGYYESLWIDIAELDLKTEYFISISDGLISDLAGNAWSQTEPLSFRTVTPPTLIDASPSDGDVLEDLGANISLVFDQPVRLSNGTIALRKDSPFGELVEIWDTVFASQFIRPNNKTIELNPTNDLEPGSHYYVIASYEAIVDYNWNSYLDQEAYDFYTAGSGQIDSTPPGLVWIGSNEGNGAIGSSDNIQLGYNEALIRGSGIVELREGTEEGTLVEVFDGSAEHPILVNGSVLTLNPVSDLKPNTQYSLVWTEDLVTDLAGNSVNASIETFTTLPSQELEGPVYVLNGKGGTDILLGGDERDFFWMDGYRANPQEPHGSFSDPSQTLAIGGDGDDVFRYYSNQDSNWVAPATTLIGGEGHDVIAINGEHGSQWDLTGINLHSIEELALIWYPPNGGLSLKLTGEQWSGLEQLSLYDYNANASLSVFVDDSLLDVQAVQSKFYQGLLGAADNMPNKEVAVSASTAGEIAAGIAGTVYFQYAYSGDQPVIYKATYVGQESLNHLTWDGWDQGLDITEHVSLTGSTDANVITLSSSSGLSDQDILIHVEGFIDPWMGVSVGLKANPNPSFDSWDYPEDATFIMGGVESGEILAVPGVQPVGSLVASVSSALEGEAITFSLTTQGVPEGTPLFYSISGIDDDDMSSGSVTGTMTVDASGLAVLELSTVNDSKVEGVERLTLSAYGAQASVDILDINSGVLIHEGNPLTGNISGVLGSEEYRGGLSGEVPYGIDGLHVIDSSGDATVIARVMSSERPYYASAIRNSIFEFGDGEIYLDARITEKTYYSTVLEQTTLKYGDGDSVSKIYVDASATYGARGVSNSSFEFAGGRDELDVRVNWDTDAWSLNGIDRSSLNFGSGDDWMSVSLSNQYASPSSWAITASTVLLGEGNDEFLVQAYNGLRDVILEGGDGNDVITIEAEQLALQNSALNLGLGDDLVRLTASGPNAMSIENSSIDLGSGNDTIYLQRGSAGIDGGIGEDIVWLSGLRSDYNFTDTADGVRIDAKADVFTSFNLVNIESVGFSDGFIEDLSPEPINPPPIEVPPEPLPIFTSHLGGHVYHWKSHILLSDVSLAISESGGASPDNALYEFRNGHFSESGELVLELWGQFDTATIENFGLDLWFSNVVGIDFESNLDSSWLLAQSVSTNESPDASSSLNFSLGGITSGSATLMGDQKLGTVRLQMDGEETYTLTRFSSGDAGDVALASYREYFGERSLVSDELGRYQFSEEWSHELDISLSREITPAEEGAVITSADALAALKIAVGLNPNSDGSAVSPYQYLAADVNNSGMVTSADALGILKMAVKRSDAPAREWLFVDEQFDFWNEVDESFMTTRRTVPTEDSLSIEDLDVLEATTTELNFVGVLRGDVNGSWGTQDTSSDKLGESYFYELASAHPDLISVQQFGLPVL